MGNREATMQTKPINRADGPNSDNPATDTCSRITRARSDAMRSQALLWNKTNPLCRKCKKRCKQKAAVDVIRCPDFDPKEEA